VRWHFVDPRIRLTYVNEPIAKDVPDADAVIASVWGTAEYVRDYPKVKGEKFNLIQHYAVVFGNGKEQVHAIWKAPLRNILIAKWLLKIAEEIGCKDNRPIPIGLDTRKFHPIRPLNERPERWRCCSLPPNGRDQRTAYGRLKSLARSIPIFAASSSPKRGRAFCPRGRSSTAIRRRSIW
jgi:hypothetical protein